MHSTIRLLFNSRPVYDNVNRRWIGNRLLSAIEECRTAGLPVSIHPDDAGVIIVTDGNRSYHVHTANGLIL